MNEPSAAWRDHVEDVARKRIDEGLKERGFDVDPRTSALIEAAIGEGAAACLESLLDGGAVNSIAMLKLWGQYR